MKPQSLATVLILAASIATPAADAPPQPAVLAARDFYTAYSKSRFSGLPDKAVLAKFAPQLSTQLKGLLSAAQTKQARCIKAHPGDKGPWVEGDMFTSNFEGFTSFRPGQVTGTGNKRTIVMEFSYVEGKSKFDWKDQVVMIEEGGRWVVDDVLYRRSPGFTSGFGEGLKKSLSDSGC